MATYSSRTGSSWVPNIVVAILIIAACSAMLFSQSAKIDALTQRLAELQQVQLAAAEQLQQKPAELTGSLADAIVLLPRPRDAREGRPISDTAYWVRTHDASEDQLWLVDVATKKVTKIRSWSYAYEDGGTIAVSESEKWVRVTYREPTEVAVLTSDYYFDKSAGSLLYWADAKTGHAPTVTVGMGGKTQQVQFAPADGCKVDSKKAETVKLTGLLVGTTVVPFEKPQEITCLGDDTVGYAQYPSFGEVLFTNISGAPVVRVALPWRGAAIIPLPDMAADKVTFQ